MRLTEKEKAILHVLDKRAKTCEMIIKNAKVTDKSYYLGKLDGYIQASWLITETVESIKIELEK